MFMYVCVYVYAYVYVYHIASCLHYISYGYKYEIIILYIYHPVVKLPADKHSNNMNAAIEQCVYTCTLYAKPSLAMTCG